METPLLKDSPNIELPRSDSDPPRPPDVLSGVHLQNLGTTGDVCRPKMESYRYDVASRGGLEVFTASRAARLRRRAQALSEDLKRTLIAGPPSAAWRGRGRCGAGGLQSCAGR